ncbi:MAG: helix-turn-helix domain-containing protein [Nannocystaceae bacterium]
MPRPRFATLDEARRQAILEAAADEFARAGYEAASYNQIIARAGVSKGAMYYYFDGKADLYVTTLDAMVQRLLERVGTIGEFDDAATFWIAVRDLCVRVLAFLAEEPRLAGLARGLMQPSDEAVAATLASYIAATEVYTSALIRRGQALGAVRDDLPLPLLASLLSGLGEAFDRWLLENYASIAPETLARVPDLILDLFVRTAAPLDRVIELAPPAPARKEP